MLFRFVTNTELFEELNKLDAKWSNAFVPWSDRVICHLTVNGVTRSAVGSSNDEAFSKVCQMHGLRLSVEVSA